jgi:hypothetical protein
LMRESALSPPSRTIPLKRCTAMRSRIPFRSGRSSNLHLHP